MLNDLLTRGRSLIYVKNSNGPKTDHCGTPVDIGKCANLWSLYSTYSILPAK